jgi:hypothetical protein
MRRTMGGRDRDADIDRVLIHEVYAHAVAWLLESRAGILCRPGSRPAGRRRLFDPPGE